jgi:6-phosphogluconolactonase
MMPCSSVPVLLLSLLAVTMACAPAAAEDTKPHKFRVYVGTYTDGKSQGIYLLELDTGRAAGPGSVTLRLEGLAAKDVNPSFLAIHPGRKFLYAVGETGDFGGQKTGAVSAFAIDAGSGQLTLLNRQPSGGADPCHLVVDREGKNVLVANYTGGSVAVLPIEGDGRLGKPTCVRQHEGSSVNRQRQHGPHAHSINLDAANRFAVAADLGLDKLLVYRFDAAKGLLTPNDPPSASVAPGSGPRHFAFHPQGRFAYVINELLCTVTAVTYDAERGVLKEIQTITTLPDKLRPGYSTAEVQVHPSGKFLYGSNRGHNSIAVFAIDPETGRLTSVENQPTQGKTPRNFGIDPTGTCLLAANQDSGTVALFRIDPTSGKLEFLRTSVEVPKPVCVKILPVE